MSPPDLREDRPWLTAYRNGEPRALERVFRTYAPLVFHMVRSGIRAGTGRVFVTERTEQEDLVQEVFARALNEQSRRSYDGLRPFSSWLRSIAGHVVTDHLRKTGRLHAREISLEDNAEVPASWNPGDALPLEAILREEERVAVAAYVEQLAERERALLEQRFVGGLSQRDAAEALGWSRQEVRTVEDHLRQGLRAWLKKHGV